MTLTALALAGAVSVIAPPADASTAYRYWSYWTAGPGSTQWEYATEGSGTNVPADGAVEGWRFGIAGDATRIQPSTLPDFASVCAGVDAPADGKRVAVVIDHGSMQEAPGGETPRPSFAECVITSSSTTGLQILQSITDVRLDAGFVCGIDGYPSRECAPLVEVPELSQSAEGSGASVNVTAGTSATADEQRTNPQQQETATGTPLMTAATLSILALVGFGIWRHRRQERAQ